MQNVSATAFSHLLGQKRAKEILSKSLASGRIAHAYLFRGPGGVGKKRYAEAMAMALNCREMGPEDACRHCTSCKKFLSGNHPDYVVESPDKGAIKIDQVRSLCKSLSFPPYESERRVIVVEEIHTMRAEAANSLLKTLEEPPENNVLILTAETAKNILPTIGSRCQVIPFFALSVQETVRILTDKHEIEASSAELLARLSEGSPGMALLFQRTGMMSIWQDVAASIATEDYGDDKNHITLGLAQQVADLKEDLPAFLGLLRLFFRDRLMEFGERTVGDNGQRGIVENIFGKIAAVDRAEQELARNCNRALVCEILLFRLQYAGNMLKKEAIDGRNR